MSECENQLRTVVLKNRRLRRPERIATIRLYHWFQWSQLCSFEDPDSDWLSLPWDDLSGGSWGSMVSKPLPPWILQVGWSGPWYPKMSPYFKLTLCFSMVFLMFSMVPRRIPIWTMAKLWQVFHVGRWRQCNHQDPGAGTAGTAGTAGSESLFASIDLHGACVEVVAAKQPNLLRDWDRRSGAWRIIPLWCPVR